MVSIFAFKHCLALFARKCTEVDCRQRKLRSLLCSQEQVWIRLCVSNLIARDDRDLYGIDVERSRLTAAVSIRLLVAIAQGIAA